MCSYDCPPMTPESATEKIRRIATARGFTFHWTEELKQKLRDLQLVFGDINYICRNGTVVDVQACEKTQGYSRCVIACRSPNSNGSIVRLTVVISHLNDAIKAIFVC
jgi:hypothetical protein